MQDQPEFYGLLDRFQDLALLPVTITGLGVVLPAAVNGQIS